MRAGAEAETKNQGGGDAKGEGGSEQDEMDEDDG